MSKLKGRKIGKAQLKVLSCARIWGTVDIYKASRQSLSKAENAGLIKPKYVERYSEEQKKVLRKIGYTDSDLAKQKKVYLLTPKGLNKLKQTEVYKQNRLKC